MLNDYITIPLSKTGKYAGLYEAIVSPEDADLAEFNWNVHINKYTQYAKRKISKGKRRENLLLEDEQVDHIDGNGLNCRRHNLRIASSSQNNQNKGKLASNTSGLKGVCQHVRTKRWQASIHVDGQSIYLGTFNTKKEAYVSYCAAADRYHKEFANYE